MRYFIDTEFAERQGSIDLISLGIVAEDGREFYAESSEFRDSMANDWVRANVCTKLWSRGDESRHEFFPDVFTGIFEDRASIGRSVLSFIGEDKPEFWGYYADYDWVVFCWLFGAMVDLPNGWPMYCRDIKQLCDLMGNPKLPEQGRGEHHALADARWNKLAWEFLQNSSWQKRMVRLGLCSPETDPRPATPE